MCDHQRLRPACAYAQSNQSLCLLFKYSTVVKLLTEQHFEFLSFKGGCTGSSESTHVKIPHCWKSHVAGHKLALCMYLEISISCEPQSVTRSTEVFTHRCDKTYLALKSLHSVCLHSQKKEATVGIHMSRHGVVNKSLALYPGVPSSIPGSTSLQDDTKPWSCLHMTSAFDGMLNTNSLTHSRLMLAFR